VTTTKPKSIEAAREADGTEKAATHALRAVVKRSPFADTRAASEAGRKGGKATRKG
jgi:general stress protein YciG